MAVHLGRCLWRLSQRCAHVEVSQAPLCLPGGAGRGRDILIRKEKDTVRPPLGSASLANLDG